MRRNPVGVPDQSVTRRLAAGPEEDLVAGLELPAQQGVRLLLRQVARGELVVVQRLHPPRPEARARRPVGDRIEGVGGRQILVDDPSGNPVELFQPTLPEARLDRPS